MASSFNNLRIGKAYRLTNFNQVSEFEVVEINDNENHRLKDIHSLDELFLNDLIFEGKGNDFDLDEL